MSDLNWKNTKNKKIRKINFKENEESEMSFGPVPHFILFCFFSFSKFRIGDPGTYNNSP
jgi:hypothetical protein